MIADPDEVRTLAGDPAHAARRGELEALVARLRQEVGRVDPPGPRRSR